MLIRHSNVSAYTKRIHETQVLVWECPILIRPGFHKFKLKGKKAILVRTVEM